MLQAKAVDTVKRQATPPQILCCVAQLRPRFEAANSKPEVRRLSHGIVRLYEGSKSQDLATIRHDAPPRFDFDQ
jgi:hypothetical protein